MPKRQAPLANSQVQGPPLNVDEWLMKRINNFANDPPRYEASWYGPYNALLWHYFPYKQQFMVKPQPKLRPVYTVESLGPQQNVESTQEKLSYASAGHLVLPRKKRGRESNVVVPDFTVVKASESVGPENPDRPFLYVEVKPNTEIEEWTTGRNQLHKYMRHHVDTIKTDADGLLICGAEAEIYRQIYKVNKVVPPRRVGRRCCIKDGPVQEFLHRLSTKNWSG